MVRLNGANEVGESAMLEPKTRPVNLKSAA